MIDTTIDKDRLKKYAEHKKEVIKVTEELINDLDWNVKSERKILAVEHTEVYEAEIEIALIDKILKNEI